MNKPLTEAERAAMTIFAKIFSALLVVAGFIVAGAIQDDFAQTHWIRTLVALALVGAAIALEVSVAHRLCEVPKLKPGELVRFEDGGRWVVESIERSLNQPSTVTLRSPDAFLEARVFGEPKRGRSRRA